MSIDLHTTLREAADDRSAPEPATGYQLLAQARSRSRRRTSVRAAVGAAGLAAVAAAALWGPAALRGVGDADPDAATSPRSVGAFQPSRLTFDEALDRCRPVLDSDGYPSDADWKRNPASGDSTIYAGDAVSMVLASGERLPDGLKSAICMVPYSGAERSPAWLDEPIADSEDTAGLLRQCGVVAGYDFTGWEVVTATSSAQGAEAVLRSTNGYPAFCSLEPDFGRTWAGPPAPVDNPAHISDGQEVTISNLSETELDARPFEGYFEYNFFVSCGDTRQILTDNQPEDGTLCSGSGDLRTRDGRMTDAATIEISLQGGGDTFEFPVVDGYYATRFLDDDAEVGPYDYVIKDESGAVLGRGTSPV